MENKLNVVSIRLVEELPLMSKMQIKEPKDAVKLIGKHLCTLDREVLCVINLRTDGRPVNCNFVSMGAVNESLAHPREIFKSAILANATSMIVVHNPSGNLEPSKQDTMITDRLLKLADVLGVSIVDHIIVGGKNKSYFSFKEKEILRFSSNKYETDYHNLEFPELHVAEKDSAIMEQSEETKVEVQEPEEVAVRKRRGR